MRQLVFVSRFSDLGERGYFGVFALSCWQSDCARVDCWGRPNWSWTSTVNAGQGLLVMTGGSESGATTSWAEVLIPSMFPQAEKAPMRRMTSALNFWLRGMDLSSGIHIDVCAEMAADKDSNRISDSLGRTSAAVLGNQPRLLLLCYFFGVA